jgi:hypothetical protein
MNKNKPEILFELLACSTRKKDQIRFDGQEILVRGSSGHFGMWTTLMLAYEKYSGKSLKITCETSKFDYVNSILKPLGLLGSVQPYREGTRFDIIFDFTLPPQDCSKHPDFEFCKHILSNLEASMFKVIRGTGIVVSPSSGAVYGHYRHMELPKSEQIATTAKNRGTYGDMKYLVETLSAGVDHIRMPIFRVFSTFGPLFRSNSNLVANKVFIRDPKTRSFSLDRDGKKIRNFAFIGELVFQMIYLTLMHETQAQEPLNIGTSDCLSIYDFASKIGSYNGVTIHKGLNSEADEFYFPELTLLRNYYTQHETSIDRYIELTSRYYE